VKVRAIAVSAVVVLLTAFLTPSVAEPARAASITISPATYVEPVAHPIRVLAASKPRLTQKSHTVHRTAVRPVALSSFARCVIHHESLTGGLYKAQNPTSTASGAYQFTNGTWLHYQMLAGFGHKYSRAKYAPPHIQDAVFAYAFKHGGARNWNGTHCGHGTT
jgi:hypothetical protein